MKRIPEFIILNTYSAISFGLTKFLKGEISEEEYIDTRKDEIGRVREPWPELLFLKSDMKVFAEYLLELSLMGRRLVLLEEESIGFIKTDLYNLYGIPSNTVGKYLRGTDRKKNPPKIRDMTVRPPKVSKEVIAFFAILSRVPISWLEDEKPELVWKANHFNYLPDAKMSLSTFNVLLEKYSLDVQHDVMGIIINEGVRFPLYLRLERFHCGFIIEVFNPNFGLNDLFIIRDLLKKFHYIEEGYMDTVIESQKNYTFIVNQYCMNPVCLPMEFKRNSRP
jgi:hypothetical protein